MTKCSNYAHDSAQLGGTTIPDPYELLADITALDGWRARVTKRGDDLASKRKASDG